MTKSTFFFFFCYVLSDCTFSFEFTLRRWGAIGVDWKSGRHPLQNTGRKKGKQLYNVYKRTIIIKRNNKISDVSEHNIPTYYYINGLQMNNL